MSFVLNRKILRLDGADAEKFLGDLITNSLPTGNAIAYAALLSPQGKYLFDFFVFRDATGFLLDVEADCADALVQRLSMYKLRADVTINTTELKVRVGSDGAPKGAVPDPRAPALGWRHYGVKSDDSGVDWHALYVAHCIPRTGVELIADQTYILEAGFERLNGVDFKKGCYVGQEVTARMHHKTDLRKGIQLVELAGEVPIGTDIIREGKAVGTIYSQANGQGIAHLRFDMIGPGMVTGGVAVSLPDVS